MLVALERIVDTGDREGVENLEVLDGWRIVGRGWMG